jgi:putative membrane protein
LISYSTLPLLNALFNSTAAVLLVAGLIFIRRGEVRAHRACMLSAFAVSVAFAISYIVYHAHVGDVRFLGRGWVRPLYFTILITHIGLAFVIVPLVAVTLWRALSGRFAAHRAIARWTWPIWMYVSVTGVIVYLMVYWLYPHAPIAAAVKARFVAAASAPLRAGR